MIKNGLYNSVGALLRLGLAVISVPILIHFIGIAEYGLWSLISSILMIVTLVEGGLSTATTVFVSKDLSQKNYSGITQTLSTTCSLMAVFATLAAAILWFSAEVIAQLLQNLTPEQNGTVVNALRIGTVVIWSQLFQQIIVGLGQSFQRYDILNGIGITHSILNYSGLIIISAVGGKSIEFVWWQALENCLTLVLYLLFASQLLRDKNITFSWNILNSRSKEVILYSSTTWLSTLGGRLFSQGDRIIVGSVLGTASLGIYSAILNITTLINTLSAVPVQPLVPLITGKLSQNPIDYLNIRKLVKKAFYVNTLISISLASILIFLSPEIMNLAIPGQENYGFHFSIAVVIYSIYSLNAVGYYLSFCTNTVNLTVIFQLLGGIVSLLLITIGGSRYGLIGAISGNVGFTLILFLSFIQFKRLGIYFKETINIIKGQILSLTLNVIITYLFYDTLYVRVTALMLYSIFLIKELVNIVQEYKNEILNI